MKAPDLKKVLKRKPRRVSEMDMEDIEWAPSAATLGVVQPGEKDSLRQSPANLPALNNGDSKASHLRHHIEQMQRTKQTAGDLAKLSPKSRFRRQFVSIRSSFQDSDVPQLARKSSQKLRPLTKAAQKRYGSVGALGESPSRSSFGKESNQELEVADGKVGQRSDSINDYVMLSNKKKGNFINVENADGGADSGKKERKLPKQLHQSLHAHSSSRQSRMPPTPKMKFNRIDQSKLFGDTRRATDHGMQLGQRGVKAVAGHHEDQISY